MAYGPGNHPALPPGTPHDYITQLRTLYGSWEHGYDFESPIIRQMEATRDELYNAWEQSGRQGTEPDIAAHQVLLREPQGFWTRWSDPNGIRHKILDYIDRSGGAWAGAILTGPTYYQNLAITSQEYISKHAEHTAATDSSGDWKMPLIGIATVLTAGLASGALAAGAGALETAGAAGVASTAAGAAPVFTAAAAGGLPIVELGLIATPATASAAIAAGIPAATLAGGVGALTLASGALIDIAGMPIAELGLIADPATAAAAVKAGIPATMLSGGPGAITLESLFTLPQTPPTPPRGTPPGPQAPPAGPLSKAVETAIGAAISTVAGIARQLIGQSLAPDAPAASQAPPASALGQLGSNPLVLLLLAGAVVLIATR